MIHYKELACRHLNQLMVNGSDVILPAVGLSDDSCLDLALDLETISLGLSEDSCVDLGPPLEAILILK